jgi:hypothetical protein
MNGRGKKEGPKPQSSFEKGGFRGILKRSDRDILMFTSVGE